MDGNESDRPRHKLAQLCPGFGGENREEEEKKERGDGEKEDGKRDRLWGYVIMGNG